MSTLILILLIYYVLVFESKYLRKLKYHAFCYLYKDMVFNFTEYLLIFFQYDCLVQDLYPE